MIWNCNGDDSIATVDDVDIAIAGLLNKNNMVQDYRIDKENGNSFEVWKKMGYPTPEPEQIEKLEKAGQITKTFFFTRVD